MINRRFQEKNLILASQSPRRQYLLKELGLNFEILPTHVSEDYPEGLSPTEIAIYLAELKAGSFDAARLHENSVIIAADTLVCIGTEILGKPANYTEAVDMLKKLSGSSHTVITAVCLKSRKKQKTFHVISQVYFRELSIEEIDYYIENFRPFDKAGGTVSRNGSGISGSVRSKALTSTLWGYLLRSCMRSFWLFDSSW